MALRVTRQYTDVLREGSGKARVTRQYVDVLTRIPTPVEESASASSTLELVGEADYYVARFVGDSLGLSQEIAIQLELVRDQESVLTLAQQVWVTSPINVTVEHDLGIAGLPSGVYPYYESVEDDLGLDDTSIGQYASVQSVTSELVLTDLITRIVTVEVGHDLDLSDEGLKRDISESVLEFEQVVEWGYGGLLADEILLTQSIEAKLSLTQVQSHTLGLQQSVAYFIFNRRCDQQYCPFTGEDSPVSSTLNESLDSIEAPFQLVYPAAGEVTDSVTLRAPNLGNKDRLSFNRIQRESRGGTLIIFADPIWPKIQTHVLSFSALRRSEAQDLLDFLEAYLGQEIGMIDWEQRYWRGFISVSDEPIVEDSFNSYTASFQFEGELDESWSPQIIPWLPDTPLRRVIPDYDYVNPMEPEPEPEPTEESYSTESDDSVIIGQPLYIKSSGHAALAQATTAAKSMAIGFAITSVEPTFAVNYITEGKITVADWTTIAGVVTLTAGVAYYLSLTAGKITSVVPSSGYVVRLGRATSTLTLDIEVAPPIKL